MHTISHNAIFLYSDCKIVTSMKRSAIVLVNISVAQVRVPQKLNYQYLTTSVAVVLVVRWYFNSQLVLFCVQCCICRKRLSSPRCRSELIDSAWVVIVPGQKCIIKKKKMASSRAASLLYLYELIIQTSAPFRSTPHLVIETTY